MRFVGADRFSQDIKDMLGFAPGIYWRICWKFIGPVFILVSVENMLPWLKFDLRIKGKSS